MRPARPYPNPLCKPEALLPSKKPGPRMIQRGGSVVSVGPHPPWPDKPCPRTHRAADQRGQLQGQATPVPPRPPAGELSGPEDPGLGAPCRLEEPPPPVSWGSVNWAPVVTSMVHQSWTWGALQRRGASRGCYASLFAPPPPPGSPGVMKRAERESLWVSSKRSSPKGDGAHCPGAERTRSSGKFPYNESPCRALPHLGHPTWPTLTSAPGWVEASTPAQTPPSKGSLLPRVPPPPSPTPQVPTAPQPPGVPSLWARLLISSFPPGGGCLCGHCWGWGAQGRPGLPSRVEGCSAWC